MGKWFTGHQLLHFTVIITAGLSTALGLVVLVGWYTRNVTLIQVSPAFVPMQYNTALGFLLCGTGLLTIAFGRKRLAMVCGGIVGAIGILTLVQYMSGVDLGIDQLLMRHYVTVETSHPGRMAPNTAICFILSGSALMIISVAGRRKRSPLVVGVLGSIIVALATVALSGYLSGVETAYGWGNLTRMAVHTSAGFIAVGVSVFIIGWREGVIESEAVVPNWLPFPAGIGVATIALALWQALRAKVGTVHTALPDVLLTAGFMMAMLLAVTIRVAQMSTRRANDVVKVNRELENEIFERKNVESMLEKARNELEMKVRARTHELKKALAEVQAASRAKSDFLASMSHELRTPLNAIIGFSQMLEERVFGELNEKQADYVHDIVESGVHLLSLINDVLDLAKVESGKIELELSSMDVRGFLEGNILMFREKCAERGLHLQCRVGEGVADLRIEVDVRRIRQVMFNLLSNAVKFTPKGGSVTVEAELEGDDVVVSVIDPGVGIPPEQIEQIFDEFHQITGAENSKTPGTGLGLSLSRRLVELHGGRIWAESEGEGKGSKFTFTIPVKEKSKAPGPKSKEERPRFVNSDW